MMLLTMSLFTLPLPSTSADALSQISEARRSPHATRRVKSGAVATKSVGSGSAFRSCAEARAAGAAPLRRGQSGYNPKLDRDGDGVACE